MCIGAISSSSSHSGKVAVSEHLKDKYRMMRRQGTTTLCYDVRMRDTVFVTHVHQSGNRVVHIFLDRIIDTPSLLDERVPS